MRRAATVQHIFWDVLQPLVWFLFYPAFLPAALGGRSGSRHATALATLLGLVRLSSAARVFHRFPWGDRLGCRLRRHESLFHRAPSTAQAFGSARRRRFSKRKRLRLVWTLPMTGSGTGIGHRPSPTSPRPVTRSSAIGKEIVPIWNSSNPWSIPMIGRPSSAPCTGIWPDCPESVIEYRIRTKTGQTLSGSAAKGKVVERDTTGKPLRMVGIISDITAKKRARPSNFWP